MRVATYLRVSTDKQTVEPQRMELVAFVAANGWTDVTEFSDVMSGGTLTAPLLSAAPLAGADGAGLLSRAAPIRPIIASAPAPAGVLATGFSDGPHFAALELARTRGAGDTSVCLYVRRFSGIVSERQIAGSKKNRQF